MGAGGADDCGGGVCLILGMEMGMGGNHVAQGKQEERSSTEKQEPGAQRKKEAFNFNTGAFQSFFQSTPTPPSKKKRRNSQRCEQSEELRVVFSALTDVGSQPGGQRGWVGCGVWGQSTQFPSHRSTALHEEHSQSPRSLLCFRGHRNQAKKSNCGFGMNGRGDENRLQERFSRNFEWRFGFFAC